MKLNYKIILIIGVVLLSSCAKRLTETDLPKVDRERTQDLLNVLDSLSNTRPQTFYSKISTKYSDTTRNISVKTSIRLIADSALNAIVTYAAIPVVNALVTKDSLKLVNKKEKCLVLTDLEFIKNNFGVDFTFKNIEEMLLGIPLDYDTTQKYFQIHDPYKHIISSHRKRRIRKNERFLRKDENISIQYFIHPNLQQLAGLEILSVEDTTNVSILYKSWQMVNGFNVPNEVIIRIKTPKNNILIELSYEKVSVNEPMDLYFIIPEGYEECE